jgi:hypothetical protein
MKMSNYNVETMNVQFLNQSFLDKIDQGMTKEAGVAMSAFVRQRLREDGFARKVLNPIALTAAELDRQLTEEPTVIVEKEPDSVAASMSFLGRSDIRYWKTPRYAVTMEKYASQEFKKSKFELATYRTDIRTVLQENSVKDLQAVEDLNFYNNVVSMATTAGNVYTLTGGFTKANLMAGIKNLLNYKLPVGCILMTQAMYADLLTFPATEVGSPAASELFRGEASLDNFFGYKIITTNKADILPTNQCIVFAPQEYLGQFYLLQDATVFLKVEMDIVTFQTYSAAGIGIGNTNGAIVLNF